MKFPFSPCPSPPCVILFSSAEGADWEILLFVATMSNSAKAAQACHQAEMDELRTLCDMVAFPRHRLRASDAPSLVHNQLLLHHKPSKECPPVHIARN